jgi:osmotically-inducible protein OsmY
MHPRIKNVLVLSTLTFAIAMPPAAFAQAPPASSASQMKSSGASPGQPSDSSLTQKVKQVLGNDPTTKNSAIQVNTQDRMVTLGGSVPSRKVAARAQQLAARVNGVRGIENQMRYPNQ